MRQALGVIAVVLLALYVAYHPAEAATMARHVGTNVSHLADGVAQFFNPSTTKH